MKHLIPSDLYGDATLYIGMMADVAGIEWIEALNRCVDKDGRLWRNEEEAQASYSPYSHGTSRDMLAGFLLGSMSDPKTDTLEKVAKYIARTGKIAPTGDSRTHVRPGTWLDIGDALYASGVNVKKTIGLKGWLWWKLLSPFKGLENLISVATAWSGYQLHLVLVSMIFQLRCGKRKGIFWNATLDILDHRLSQNAMVKYLKGDKLWFHAELPHMWNRATNLSKPPLVWSWAYPDHVMASYHMSTLAVSYMEYLLKDMK